MRAQRKESLAILLPLILALSLPCGAPAGKPASEGAPPEAPKQASEEKAPAARAPMATPAETKMPASLEGTAAPGSIKDRVAVWVFLAWVWLATIVSVGFLRLKIKECDRLQAMAFHESPRRPPRGGAPPA